MHTKNIFKTFAGYDIIKSNNMFPPEFEQIKYPRTKKKRIIKKWSKNKKYFGYVNYHYILVNQSTNMILVDKDILECIKNDFDFSCIKNKVKMILFNKSELLGNYKPFPVPYAPVNELKDMNQNYKRIEIGGMNDEKDYLY